VDTLSDAHVPLVGHSHLPHCRFFPAVLRVGVTLLGSTRYRAALGSVAAVPRRRGETRRPVEYLADPTVDFSTGALIEDAPVEVVAVHALARNLAAALEDRALIQVCAEAGLNRSTVQDLLAGRSFCDVVTVAKLEATLGVGLWGDAEGLG
jgi:hypothetical protein